MSVTYNTPCAPGSSTKRPGSKPATSNERLADSTIAREVRSAVGTAHIEHNPITSTTGSAIVATGRNNWRGPKPTALSTAISESRYKREMASIKPINSDNGSNTG